MRLHLFFSASLIACGGTLRNAAPEPLASSPVPPGFDRFHSSVVHQSIEGSASVGADGNVAVTDVSQRMTLLLHDRGARISFGTVSSAERGGARDKKLACMDRTFMDFRGVHVVATDVERASVTDSIGDLAGGCAIKSDATVVCWGGFNELGQSGDGKRGPHDGPWNVKGVANAIDVARGPLHACALTKEHAVMCWGAADEYAFGDAALASATHFRTCDQGESPGGGNCVTKAPMGKTNGALHLVPVRVPELEGVVSIAVGADVTCGLRTDGVVLCVGNGHAGPWTLRTR